MPKKKMIVLVFVPIAVLLILFSAFLATALSPGRNGIEEMQTPNSHEYYFGNFIPSNFVGWRSSANVSYSTTFVTTKEASGFVQADVGLFPYQIANGTTMSSGFYLNGKLVADRTDILSEASSIGPTILQGANLYEFGASLADYLVVDFLNGSSSVPPNTVATVTVEVTQPVWFLLGNSSIANSYLYNTTNPLSPSLPSDLTLQNPSGYSASQYPLGLSLSSFTT